MKEKFKKINIFYSYFYSKSSETREIINTIILLNLVYQNIELEKFFKTSSTMEFDLSNILYVYIELSFKENNNLIYYHFFYLLLLFVMAT
jgi:hypothetical protein